MKTMHDINLFSDHLKHSGYLLFNGFVDDFDAFTHDDLVRYLGMMVEGLGKDRDELFMLQHHDSEIPAEMRAGQISPDTRDKLVRRIRSRLHTAKREWQVHSIYRIRLQEWSLNDLRILLAANRKEA